MFNVQMNNKCDLKPKNVCLPEKRDWCIICCRTRLEFARAASLFKRKLLTEIPVIIKKSLR